MLQPLSEAQAGKANKPAHKAHPKVRVKDCNVWQRRQLVNKRASMEG
jgi:hypothetical protein